MADTMHEIDNGWTLDTVVSQEEHLEIQDIEYENSPMEFAEGTGSYATRKTPPPIPIAAYRKVRVTPPPIPEEVYRPSMSEAMRDALETEKKQHFNPFAPRPTPLKYK